MDDVKQIENSALWAAYGDALGFMTEFATASLVRSKYGKSLITVFQSSKRRVGGRFGVTINLPEGCYSDDTQLRLATSRSITFDGGFDIEAFARVELPVWPAYALGGGRSTKTASVHLATAGVSWLTNFYQTKDVEYLNAGGNGAAMRIQPHVWAARDWNNPQTYVPAVIRNTVCTHGHPRALVGAVFHALTLAATLRAGRVPDPSEFESLGLQAGAETGKTIEADKDLSSLWLGVWERESKKSFQDALRSANDDLLRDLGKAQAATTSSQSFLPTYGALAEALDAYSASNRGSAISTTIMAAYLASLTREEPKQAAIISANALGTDTDTVATMACALLGAAVEQPPPQLPMDTPYISAEAHRLARVRTRSSNQAAAFAYPDLLQWEPPRTQLDAVTTNADGEFVVAGLGLVKSRGEFFVQPQPQDGAVWQWVELEFGQHLLIKRRKRPRPMKTAKPSIGAGRRGATSSPGLFEGDRQQASPAVSAQRKFYGGGSDSSLISVEEAVRRALESNYDPLVIGNSLLALSNRSRGVELAVAFAAVVATRGQRTSQKPNAGARVASPRQEQPSQPRTIEDFSLVTRKLEGRIFVVVKNQGDAETFKGQIVRLSNVEKLPSPLPWTIRWQDSTSDVVTIEPWQEAILELARVQPAGEGAKIGGRDFGVLEFFTPRDIIPTKLRSEQMDEPARPVEAVLRITTNNPRRSKSVTVLLSTSLAHSQLSVSMQE